MKQLVIALILIGQVTYASLPTDRHLAGQEQKVLSKEFETWADSISGKPSFDQSAEEVTNFFGMQKCRNCTQGKMQTGRPDILVFMSFSMPDSSWISLSAQLEKVNGAFVIRGLPDNSFKKLAQKILDLKKKGVNAPIEIDPIAFREFEVENVPAFVVKKQDGFSKLYGNVSLSFALEKIKRG